jgi:outer membrane protein assembly factor BamB
VTLLGLLLATGRVELRDPDTGRILRSGQIDGSAGTGGTDRYAEIVGDLLMTRMGSRLTAYDLDRLDRRWTINLQPGQDGWVAGCGRLLCLHGQSWQGISVLDPQTGRVKWSDPRWSDLLTVGEHLVAMEPDPQQDTRRLTVIDPETGHGRRDLGEWQALDWNQSAGSAIGVRFEFTRAVVARLDPERGPQVLGVLHGVSRVCWVNAPTLLCRRSDNRLGVWRLPD